MILQNLKPPVTMSQTENPSDTSAVVNGRRTPSLFGPSTNASPTNGLASKPPDNAGAGTNGSQVKEKQNTSTAAEGSGANNSKSRAVTAVSTAMEVFDPYGDLKLIAGPEKVVFRVCCSLVAHLEHTALWPLF